MPKFEVRYNHVISYSATVEAPDEATARKWWDRAPVEEVTCANFDCGGDWDFIEIEHLDSDDAVGFHYIVDSTGKSIRSSRDPFDDDADMEVI